MALQDYAQRRAERVWARSQPTVGTFEMPKVRDAIKLRGPGTLPATASDFVVSEEVRDTPDTDQLLKRKKPPAEFSLTVYAKVPATPGRLMQSAMFLKDTFGVETLVLEVLDFAQLETDNATVTVTVDGTATVLTEDAEWQAAGSNAAAATSLAAAIHALAGVTASAVGAEVRVVRDQGIGEVTVATSALAADLRINETRYTLTSDILEQLLTVVHSTHNSGDYYRDCKTSGVAVRANGGDEAVLVYTGFLGNSVTVHDCLLTSEIEAINASSLPRTDADEVTFTVDRFAFQLGPTAEDVAYCTIGTEHFKVTAFDRATKTATAFGAQFSSASAAHSAGAEVLHYVPGADPEANDQILSMVLGAFTFEGDTYRVISIDTTKDEGLVPRLDEAFEAALTGYQRPNNRVVGGTIQAYQRNPQDPTGAVVALTTFSEAEAEGVASLRLGSATGARIVVSWPHFRLARVEKGESGGEFTRSFPFQGLASGTPGNDGVSLTVFTA